MRDWDDHPLFPIISPPLTTSYPTPISTASPAAPSTSSTATSTPAQVSSATTSSLSCPTLNCPSSSRTCPPCQTGFVCRLSVIDATCECPVASCVKPAFDTGTGSSNTGSGFSSLNNTTNSKSILAPVLGGVVGLIAVTVVALLISRYKRSKAANGDTMLDRQGKQDHSGYPFNNRDANFNDDDQSWRGLSSDTIHQKDVIQIGYAPSINEDQLYRIPEIAHLGGGPRLSFFTEEDDKHSSLASSLSTGVLDEAVSMAISNVATPKLMQLNNIRIGNRDMIRKSNSLHSSNSLKRSQSQSRPMEYKGTTTGRHGTGAGAGESTDETHSYSHFEQKQQFTPAVMVTAPSARSSAQSTASATQRPRPPSMVLEPRPLHPSYNIYQSTSLPTSSQELCKVAAAPLGTIPVPRSTASPPPPFFPSSSSSLSNPRIRSVLIQHPERGREYDNNVEVLRRCRTDGGNGTRNNAPQTTGSSIFSTQSDSRSTMTRGDGEEIMIFWDGNRDSRASSSM